MPRPLLFLAPLAALILSGGLASAAMATPGPPDAGENRGRAVHERNEKIRKLEKRYNRRLEACNRGETAACAEANRISGEITALRAER